MNAAEMIAKIGLMLMLVSQLLGALAVIQLRHEKRSLWILIMAHALILASIGCVVYECSYFGF